MQRPEAKNPPKRPSTSAETGNLKMGVKNPRGNGLFAVDVEICGLGRLGGGRTRARTWDPMIKSQQNTLRTLVVLTNCTDLTVI